MLFLCGNRAETRFSFHDLSMGEKGHGCGPEFETLPPDGLVDLLNGFYLIFDQARFECIRCIGRPTDIPWSRRPIIEIVLDPESYEYETALVSPRPTPEQHACEEDVRGHGIDRGVPVRKHFPEAMKTFRERILPREATSEVLGNRECGKPKRKREHSATAGRMRILS